MNNVNPKSLLFDLQEAYLTNKTKDNWQAFFSAVSDFCTIAIQSICKQKSLTFSKDYVEEKALDATTQFLENYSKPEYRIREWKAFPQRLRKECIKVLFCESDKDNYPQRYFESNVESLEDFQVKNDECDISELPFTYEDNSLPESEERELLSLSEKAKDFDSFIKSVVEIHGKQYCYDNVKKLIYLFKDSGIMESNHKFTPIRKLHRN